MAALHIEYWNIFLSVLQNFVSLSVVQFIMSSEARTFSEVLVSVLVVFGAMIISKRE